MVSVISSGVVSVSAVVATAITARADRHQARNLAESARIQARRERTYTEVLRITQRLYLEATAPVGAWPQKKSTADADLELVNALTAMHGSPEVLRATEGYIAEFRSLYTARATILTMRARQVTGNSTDDEEIEPSTDQLLRAPDRLLEIQRRLVELIRRDLGTPG
jgi:hypothetical protein